MKVEDIAVVEDAEEVHLIPDDPSRENLVEALNRAGLKMGQGFLDFLALEAYNDPKIAMKLLDKLIPNLNSNDIKNDTNVNISISELIERNKVSPIEGGDAEVLEHEEVKGIEELESVEELKRTYQL